MEKRVETLENEIEQIKNRNKRVEENKAWETSTFRIVSICVLTYIVVAVFLYFIGVSNFLVSAIIPIVGFFLSTRSLDFLKNRWLRSKHIN